MTKRIDTVPVAALGGCPDCISLPNAARFYIRVLDLSEEAGIYPETEQEVAAALGMTPGAIRNCLAELVTLGWLTPTQPGRGAGLREGGRTRG